MKYQKFYFLLLLLILAQQGKSSLFDQPQQALETGPQGLVNPTQQRQQSPNNINPIPNTRARPPTKNKIASQLQIKQQNRGNSRTALANNKGDGLGGQPAGRADKRQNKPMSEVRDDGSLGFQVLPDDGFGLDHNINQNPDIYPPVDIPTANLNPNKKGSKSQLSKNKNKKTNNKKNKKGTKKASTKKTKLKLKKFKKPSTKKLNEQNPVLSATKSALNDTTATQTIITEYGLIDNILGAMKNMFNSPSQKSMPKSKSFYDQNQEDQDEELGPKQTISEEDEQQEDNQGDSSNDEDEEQQGDGESQEDDTEEEGDGQQEGETEEEDEGEDSSDDQQDSGDKKSYQSYKKGYLRNYQPELQGYRKQVYKKNRQIVKSHNSQRKSYRLQQNQFSDLSSEQFHQQYLMQDLPQMPQIRAPPMAPPSDFEVSPIDWRKKMHPAKHQKKCGACWAFSVIGVMETIYRIQKKKPIELSVQQVVDCCKDGCNGCRGGWPVSALEYYNKNGVALEEDYPYANANNQCQQPEQTIDFLQPQNSYSVVKDINSLGYAIQQSPVSVIMDATTWQQFYKSGVFDQCPTDNISYNHAVILVGIDEDGNWIVRNSWGDKWGDKGHIYLPPGNSCGIADMGVVPNMRPDIEEQDEDEQMEGLGMMAPEYRD